MKLSVIFSNKTHRSARDFTDMEWLAFKRWSNMSNWNHFSGSKHWKLDLFLSWFFIVAKRHHWHYVVSLENHRWRLHWFGKLNHFAIKCTVQCCVRATSRCQQWQRTPGESMPCCMSWHNRLSIFLATSVGWNLHHTTFSIFSCYLPHKCFPNVFVAPRGFSK